MASDDQDPGGAQASTEPEQCMPCHGSGQVISNLGGSPRQVTCPWCRGAGVRLPTIDAQAHWRQAQDGQGGSGEAGAGADVPRGGRDGRQAPDGQGGSGEAGAGADVPRGGRDDAA